jgi:hypothetical protein
MHEGLYGLISANEKKGARWIGQMRKRSNAAIDVSESAPQRALGPAASKPCNS